MSVLKKSVLITGCSAGGIGGALAEAFHEKGYHVFAALRDPSKLPSNLKDASNVSTITLDVLSSDSIAAAVDFVKEKTGGKLDVLINNSGGGYTVPGLDASIQQGKRLFDLNFWAPLAMLQAFAPQLIEAKGCLVNNVSVSAYCPIPLMSMYNGSKGALAMASETWRHELQPLGVRTITLATSGVKTKILRSNYSHEADLPENSYYSSVQQLIRRITDGQLQAKAISAEEYAAQVVHKVDGGASGVVWAGTDPTFSRLAMTFLPQFVLDMIVQSLVPLSSEMAKATQKNKI